MRQRISSGSPWEPIVGYSRAMRSGSFLAISGSTAAQPDGSVAHVGDMHGQARATLEVIGGALAEAGAGFEHVIRTRMYVTDISRWEEAGRAHAEVFAEIRPATSMVAVSRLIHPDMLIEIEADAIVPERR